MKACVGYYNPLGDLSGYCVPIFKGEGDDTIYRAVITDGNIFEFKPATHLASLYIPHEFHLFVKIGEAEVFIFKFGGEFFCGNKEALLDIFKRRMDQLQEYPHLLRNIGRLLGDRSMRKAGRAAIGRLLEKEFQGYDIFELSRDEEDVEPLRISYEFEIILEIREESMTADRLVLDNQYTNGWN